ncbi:MAG: DUF4278 domain-containing protein [Cyanobacteria bacterium P01_H01_bin.119]
MEMSYRGAHYQKNLPTLELTGETQIGTYRGAPLTARYFKPAAHTHGRTQLTYRGIKYDQTI